MSEYTGKAGVCGPVTVVTLNAFSASKGVTCCSPALHPTELLFDTINV